MTHPNKVILSLIIFSLIYLILIVFVILPLFSGIKESSQDLVSQKQSHVSFEAQLQSLNKFKTLYQEIEPDLEKTSTFFVNPEVPVKFISFLETTASNCQLLTEISSALPVKTEGDPWSSLVFQISSFGSIPQFLKFLEKLEASSYLVKIQGLNIRRLTESDLSQDKLQSFSLGDLSISFSIKVFTQ